jgi:hypothetical protein
MIEIPEKFDRKKKDLLYFFTKILLYIEYYNTRFPNKETNTIRGWAGGGTNLYRPPNNRSL